MIIDDQILPACGGDFEAIPEAMRANPNWLVYRLERRPNTPKLAKVPKCYRTGRNIDHTDVNQLGSFEDVVHAYQSGPVPLDGIGYSFGHGCGLMGIDMDDCVSDGVLTNGAYARIVSSLDSYCEYSPSGSGLHLIVKATLPSGRRKKGVEIYPYGRFFTVSGRPYGELRSIREGERVQRQVMALWRSMGPVVGDDHSGVVVRGEAPVYTPLPPLRPTPEQIEFIQRHWLSEYRVSHQYETHCPDASLGDFVLLKELQRACGQVIGEAVVMAAILVNRYRLRHGHDANKAFRGDYVQRTLNRAWLDLAGEVNHG